MCEGLNGPELRRKLRWMDRNESGPSVGSSSSLGVGYRVGRQCGVHQRDVVAVVLGHREVDVGSRGVRVQESAVEAGYSLDVATVYRRAPWSGWLRGQPDHDRAAHLLRVRRFPGCDGHHFPTVEGLVVAD